MRLNIGAPCTADSGEAMSRHFLATFIISLLITVSASALSPVGTYGKLRVVDGKIVGSSDGAPAQLAGMSLFWSLWEGEKYFNRSVVNWLVTDWHITVIRAPLGIGQTGSYDTDPNNEAGQYARIKAVVDAAIANGIYVIVDYHAHDANLSVDKAKKFFGDMSKEYADVPNIIWEIWNEPDEQNGTGQISPKTGKPMDSWEDIKKYAAEVIPVIRDNSDNLIIVGTPYWSQHVDIAAADPIREENIAYTLHFYAAQPEHQDSLRARARAAVAQGAALFITEFGTTISDGGSDGVVDSTQTAIWLDWADSNYISWANWSIVDKNEASAALAGGAPDSGGWKADQLTTSGKLIRNRLRSRPEFDFSDIIPADGKSLPGIIEAESFAKKSNDLKAENTSDAGGGQSLGYTTNGAWAEYSVTVRREGKYTAKVRVAADQGYGGTITAKIDGEQIASWTIATTGGWSNWATVDSCDTFSLSRGDATLRLEWSGSASSLVNLNWIEFVCHTVPIEAKTPRTFPAGMSKQPVVTTGNGFISVMMPDEIAQVELLSLDGKIFRQASPLSKRIRLPVAHGVYLLSLRDKDGSRRTFRILAQR